MNPLDALKSWLQDNIDMGSDLCFDNDGKVKSEHVLAAFDSLPYKEHPQVHATKLHASHRIGNFDA